MIGEFGSNLTDVGRPPGEGLDRLNAADARGSYRATELAPRGAQSWTFTVRWRDRGAGLSLRREKVIPYYHLGEIDQTGSQHLSLITSYSLIHLEGEGLSLVLANLRKRQVDAIQEWDPDLWDRPAAGEPVIMRIWVEAVGSMRRAV